MPLWSQFSSMLTCFLIKFPFFSCCKMLKCNKVFDDLSWTLGDLRTSECVYSVCKNFGHVSSYLNPINFPLYSKSIILLKRKIPSQLLVLNAAVRGFCQFTQIKTQNSSHVFLRGDYNEEITGPERSTLTSYLYIEWLRYREITKCNI